MKFLRILLLGIALVGCGVIGLAVLFSWLHETNAEIESSGIRRTYLLYIPEGYQPGIPTPLVISMHGFAEWPAHQRDISRWNDLADKQGFIVVYPTGTDFPLRWNSNGSSGGEGDTSVDVAFISDLIDTLAQEYSIDLNRVYANGLSNGGGMAYVLACTLADRIAAIGGVAGAYSFPADDCRPTRPVPVIAFHVTDDKIVPYDGGQSSPHDFLFPAVPDWAQSWALRNGCKTGPLEFYSQGEVTGIRYTDCKAQVEVHFYSIRGGGHAWPGGSPMPAFIVGHTTQDVDATRLMWDFFRRFTLNQ